MSKVTLNDITTGYGSTDLYNSNNATIEAAFDNTISRDGTSPNQMAADIDLNDNDLLNVNALDVQALSVNGVNVTASSLAATEIPVQTGHAGEYLKTNGTTASWNDINASNIVYTPPGVYATNRYIDTRLIEITSIKDFGAVGDSTTDDTAAIQATIDYVNSIGGGIVFVPPTRTADVYYRITTPLVPKDNVYILGAGYGSFIRNDRTVSSTTGDQSVFMIGGYTGSSARMTDDETYHNLATGGFTKGDGSVTYYNPYYASLLSVGDIVFIRSSITDPNTTAHSSYNYMDINEVTSADGGTGVVGLKYPCYDTVTGTTAMGTVSGTVTNPLGYAANIVKNIKISNLRLQNHYDATYGIMLWGGALGFELSDLHVSGSDFAALNGMCRGLIKNVRGNISTRAVELAYGSGFVDIENCQLTQGIIPTSAQGKIVFGDFCHDIHHRRCVYSTGETDQNVVLWSNGIRCTMEDCDLISQSTNRVVFMRDTGTSGYGPDGGKLIGNRIHANSTHSAAIEFDNPDAVSVTAMNIIKDNIVYGSPTRAVKITSGSSMARIEETNSPSNTILNNSTDTSIILRNNDVLTQNYPIRDGYATALTVKGTETTAATYSIAANGCSSTGSWIVRAWGTANTSADAGTRRIRIYIGSTIISTLTLETSMSGKSWYVESTIINRDIYAQSTLTRRMISDGIGPDSTQQLISSVETIDFTSAQDITLQYQLYTTDTSVVLRGFEVEPFGHDQA